MRRCVRRHDRPPPIAWGPTPARRPALAVSDLAATETFRLSALRDRPADPAQPRSEKPTAVKQANRRRTRVAKHTGTSSRLAPYTGLCLKHFRLIGMLDSGPTHP